MATMKEKVFDGYTPTRKHVEFFLGDEMTSEGKTMGHLYVHYTASGVTRVWNEELYSEDDDFRTMLTNAGYTRN